MPTLAANRRSFLALLLVASFGTAGLLAAADAVAASPAAESPAPPLDGLFGRAEVSGPRGQFTTEIVSLADGTLRFVQRHPTPRAATELLALGERAFQREAAGAFAPAPPAIAAFAHGHDVPRLALAHRRRQPGGERPARLEVAVPAEGGGGTVTIELDDWRTVAGHELPFAATFTHSAKPAEHFVYRYVELLPFRLAPGSPWPDGASEPATLFDRLGDLGELVAAHERVLAAHRASDAAALAADSATVTTVSGRGRLSESTRDEHETRMRGYLGAIRFSRYADLVPPVVALSADGTLGWLACEVETEGTRRDGERSEPVAAAWSWVELYARAPDGERSVLRWLSIGNASSQRP